MSATTGYYTVEHLFQGQEPELSVQSGDIIDESAEVVHHDSVPQTSGHAQTSKQEEEVRNDVCVCVCVCVCVLFTVRSF